MIVYAAKIISKPASYVLDFRSVRPWIIVVRIKVKLEEIFNVGGAFVVVVLKAPLLHLLDIFIVLQSRWHLV